MTRLQCTKLQVEFQGSTKQNKTKHKAKQSRNKTKEQLTNVYKKTNMKMRHIKNCKSRKEICTAVVANQIKRNVDLYSAIEAEPKRTIKRESFRAQ